MPCECLSKMAGIGSESFGKHHHINCRHYATNKYTYLFYYSDGFDAWIPVSEKTGNVVDVLDFDANEEREIKFKRVDMTDKEYDEMPSEE